MMDTDEVHNVIPRNMMEPYWHRVMTVDSTCAPDLPRSQRVPYLWSPVYARVIGYRYPAASAAPGPVGVSAKLLRSIPVGIVERILNLFM